MQHKYRIKYSENVNLSLVLLLNSKGKIPSRVLGQLLYGYLLKRSKIGITLKECVKLMYESVV